MLSGLQGNNPIILKLGLDHEAITREAFAFKCFAGYGAVHVLAEDKGMLLLERAVPGTSLKDYFPTKEKESIEIACEVMQKLHQANIPTTHNFHHIKDWLTALDKDWPFLMCIYKKQESFGISCYKLLSQTFCSMAICMMTIFFKIAMTRW